MDKKTSLGDRMKCYESVPRIFLTRRTPVIIRLDGKAFHTFTRGMEKPFDSIFVISMQETMEYLCKNIQNCVFGYTQSDEITLVLVDYASLDTEPWFGNNVQKMVSVSASMATLAFNMYFESNVVSKGVDCESQYYTKFNTAMFDSRVFSIPKEEVTNCILWRQQDATRNSIQSVGQYYFSNKQLFKKSTKDIIQMLQDEKDVLWTEYPTYLKRGSACIKNEYGEWFIDFEMPILTEDRYYVDALVEV
jgi:tRNA(His) guanylyltransferase